VQLCRASVARCQKTRVKLHCLVLGWKPHCETPLTLRLVTVMKEESKYDYSSFIPPPKARRLDLKLWMIKWMSHFLRQELAAREASHHPPGSERFSV
jgi:hypothetical protein